jgi:effector-binding domain-containing protein
MRRTISEFLIRIERGYRNKKIGRWVSLKLAQALTERDGCLYLVRMGYTVRVERVPNLPIAVVRRRVAPSELAKVVPEACGLVWKTIRAAQVKDAGRHVAVYRDAGDGLVDVEVGVEVGTAFSGRDDVVGSVLSAGDVATVTHFGPYRKLGEAHQAIRKWCAAQGRTLAGVNWELYGHWLDEWNNDPSKIRTDVFYLLKS